MLLSFSEYSFFKRKALCSYFMVATSSVLPRLLLIFLGAFSPSTDTGSVPSKFIVVLVLTFSARSFPQTSCHFLKAREP